MKIDNDNDSFYDIIKQIQARAKNKDLITKLMS
jgi:hypothetical protein